MSKFTNNKLCLSSENEELRYYVTVIFKFKRILLDFTEVNSIETILEHTEFWSMVHKYLKKIYQFITLYPSVTFKTYIIIWLSALEQISNKHPDISLKIIDGPLNLIMSFILKKHTGEIPPWFFRILIKICCKFIECGKLFIFEEKLLTSLFELHYRYSTYHLKRTVLSSIVQYFDHERIYNFLQREYKDRVELKKLFISVLQNYSSDNIRVYLNKFNQFCNPVQIISFKYSHIKIGDVILSEDDWIDFNILSSSVSFECPNFVLPEEMEEDEIEIITIKFLSILNVIYRSHLTGRYLTFELDSPCLAFYESTNNYLKNYNTVTIYVTENTMRFQNFVIDFFQKMSSDKQFNPETFPTDQDSNGPQFFNFSLRLNSKPNVWNSPSQPISPSSESDTVSGKYSLIFPAKKSRSDSQIHSNRSSSVANSNTSYESPAIIETSQKSLAHNRAYSSSEIPSCPSPSINELNIGELNLSVPETIITEVKEKCSNPMVVVDQIDLVTPSPTENVHILEPPSHKSLIKNRRGPKRRRSTTKETIGPETKKSKEHAQKPIREFKENSYYNFEDEAFFTDSERCTRTSTRTVRPPKRLINEIVLLRDGYTTDSTLVTHRKRNIRKLQQTTNLTTDIPSNPDILTPRLTSPNSITSSGQKRIKTILPVKKQERQEHFPASNKGRRNTISGPESNLSGSNNSNIGAAKRMLTNIKLIDYLEDQHQNNSFKLNLNPNQPTKLIQTCGQESNLTNHLRNTNQNPVMEAFDKLLLGYSSSPDPNKRSAILNYFDTSSSNSQKSENVPQKVPVEISKVTPKKVIKRGRKSNTESKKPKKEPKQSKKTKKETVSTVSSPLNDENSQKLPIEESEKVTISEIDATMNKIHSIFNNFKNTYDKFNDDEKYKFYDLFKDFFNSCARN